MACSLTGRVALVTGNSTGLGKGTAEVLARTGARVAINYYSDEQRANTALAEMNQAGLTCALVRGDVSSEAGVEQVFAATE